MKSCIKTCLLAVLIVGVVLASQASAGWKPQVVLGPGTGPDHVAEPFYQQWNRTLSADTLYILTGFYYVDSTYSLTIPEGTVCMGDTGATLVIQRGAEIHARGTVERPIVFTSMKDPGDREAGDWGGVVILGEAPVNQVNPVIEGGLLDGYYGGNVPDDDSGEFYYCRIEWPGYRIQEGNEVNGLTMGGVGTGTEIHHVQVSYSNDDSFEWFGGGCDMDYLVAYGGLDDVFDTDFGHSGRHQFCFALRDPDYFDDAGQANGYESDNMGSANPVVPRTQPTFANCTIVGPEYNDGMVGNLPPGHTFEYSAVLRRCTQHKIHNSVIMGFPYGLSVRDGCTSADALTDTLNVHYTSIQATLRPGTSTSVHDEGRWAGVTAWFNAEPGNNATHSQPRNPSTVGLTNMANFNDPDPTPTGTSELVTVPANWLHSDVSTYFQQVSYRGAFEPGKTMDEQWTAGWTNFDPQNTDYDPVAAGVDEVVTRPVAARNYPNPFNPVTNIAYSVREAGPVTIDVLNVAGKVVRTLLDTDVQANTEGTVVWNGRDDHGTECASGVYFYRVKTDKGSETRKMVMLK